MDNSEVHVDNENEQPLVSVIIPCYNNAAFIGYAIDSVLGQTYKHVEIIVVDDGSVDDLISVLNNYPAVRVYRQKNMGPSPARNNGISQAKGEFLVFLDADDWLLPEALELNLSYFKQQPDLTMVSGSFTRTEEDQFAGHLPETINPPYFIRLLEGNYIGMIATVMWRRTVFGQFRFDDALRGCEDYDLYLNVARVSNVRHHSDVIAVYRSHGGMSSGNIIMMLNTAKKVLSRQEPYLKSKEERDALAYGKKSWEQYYTAKMFQRLLNIPFYKIRLAELKMLKEHDENMFKIIRGKMKRDFLSRLKHFWAR